MKFPSGIPTIQHFSNPKSMKILLTTFLILLSFNIVLAETEVTKISFRQNSSFDDDELLDILHSEEDEEFEPRLIKLDRILLNNFFRKNGYLLVEVSDSLVFSKNRKEVEIKYIIDPGQRYYYGGVRFKGVKELDEKKLAGHFEGIKIGSPFDESLIIDARKKVENEYYNKGKLIDTTTKSIMIDNDNNPAISGITGNVIITTDENTHKYSPYILLGMLVIIMVSICIYLYHLNKNYLNKKGSD